MNTLDYIVIGVYLIGLLSLGFIFKQSKNSNEYFLGGRSMGWLALSLSTMATQLSAISFISAPAFVGLREGGGMQWLAYEFAVPLAMAFLMVFLIPPLYKSGVVSIYEYLEKRFNSGTRLLISFVFQVGRSLATGVMVYAMALILQAVIGLDFWVTILIIGLITLIYSFQGGMKAIVYGDTMQMLLLFGGIILCVVFGLKEIGGWAEFTNALDYDRLTAVDFSKIGWNDGGFGFWPMLIGGFFLYASYYGTDQTQAQRIISAKNEGAFKSILLANGLFRFPVTLTYCVMGLILGTLFFQDQSFQTGITAIMESSGIDKQSDLLVPVFIMQYLPGGVRGLLIVGILAAAMSSLSSAINSLSAVTTEDYVKKFITQDTDKLIGWSKYLSIFWGIVCLLFAFYAGDIAPTVIEAVNKVSSAFSGPILATFILATMFKNVRGLPMNIGIIVGVVLNLYFWKFVPELFWFWWNAVGAIVTFSVAILFNVLLGYGLLKPNKESKVSWSPQILILLLFTVLIIVLSLTVNKWLV